MMNLLSAFIAALLMIIVFEEAIIFGICRFINGPGKAEKALGGKLKQTRMKLAGKK